MSHFKNNILNQLRISRYWKLPKGLVYLFLRSKNKIKAAIYPSPEDCVKPLQYTARLGNLKCDGYIFDESGSILLEMAVSLPVLILLFLVSADGVRALQAQQKLALFTKEISHATFQDCIELDEPKECIAKSYNTIANSAKIVFEPNNIEFMLSFYSCEEDATGNCLGGVKLLQKCPNYTENEVTDDATSSCVSSFETKPSKYKSRFSNGGSDLDILKRQKKIVVTEAFYKFTPFVSISPFNFVIYDSAVY